MSSANKYCEDPKCTDGKLFNPIDKEYFSCSNCEYLKHLSKNAEYFNEQSCRWNFLNKVVCIREYGAGAELIGKDGRIIADFSSHLDLEELLEKYERVI